MSFSGASDEVSGFSGSIRVTGELMSAEKPDTGFLLLDSSTDTQEDFLLLDSGDKLIIEVR